MDRYIIREPRAGAECLQGNQIIAFPTSTAGNNMIPETYYTPYGSEYQNVRENTYSLPHKSYAPGNMMQVQTPMSGIDPNYLAAYSNNNAQYIAGHQQMHRDIQMERQMQFRTDPSFGSDYQNRSLVHADRNKCKTFAQPACEVPRQYESRTPQVNFDNKLNPQIRSQSPPRSVIEVPRQFESRTPQVNFDNKPKPQIRAHSPPRSVIEVPRQFESRTPQVNFDNKPKPQIRAQSPPRSVIVPLKKTNETETPKNELQNPALTRFDKLKALHKSGPRAFTGPIEKVLKWHKALQDIGVLIIFEIIAKCVSIQPGQSRSKNLVLRGDTGPAMQVVYYEIDFLLPELKPPCTVRVVGRMMPGTCRLQAFNVRPATGDDVATLPRRAAVASHHVAKLCKEFGNADKL